MLNNPGLRRPLALLLVVLGAVAMLLAPDTWAGLGLLGLGVLLEAVGIALRDRDPP